MFYCCGFQFTVYLVLFFFKLACSAKVKNIVTVAVKSTLPWFGLYKKLKSAGNQSSICFECLFEHFVNSLLIGAI